MWQGESEPSKEYESMRRRAYRDVQELWFFARSKLDLLKKESKAVASKVGPYTLHRRPLLMFFLFKG